MKKTNYVFWTVLIVMLMVILFAGAGRSTSLAKPRLHANNAYLTKGDIIVTAADEDDEEDEDDDEEDEIEDELEIEMMEMDIFLKGIQGLEKISYICSNPRLTVIAAISSIKDDLEITQTQKLATLNELLKTSESHYVKNAIRFAIKDIKVDAKDHLGALADLKIIIQDNDKMLTPGKRKYRR